MNNNVPLILLGSFLALAATASIEIGRTYYQLRLARKNFSIFLKLQLNSIQEILNKIKAKHDASHYYDYLLIGLLENEVLRLDNARTDAITLKASNLQEKFFRLLTELSLFTKDIRGIQDLFYGEKNKIDDPKKNGASVFKSLEELEKVDNQRRNEKAIELIEINRKIDELVKDLK